jgi:hypothetical protein
MSISILDYDLRDLEIPTITVVGKLVKAGIPVLVYRYVRLFGRTYGNNLCDEVVLSALL